MSTSVNPFVCQETFHPDNTTSCIRYDKLKRCDNEGTASNIPFLCVGQDTISIGAGGPMKPLPLNLTTSVFICNLTSCPNAAPPKEKSGKNSGNSSDSTSASIPSAPRSLSLSSIFVLALIMSQMVLF